jgi:methionine-rich copper-binding protein CopC
MRLGSRRGLIAKRRAAGRPLELQQLEARQVLSGTWTGLTNLAPDGTGTMMLLSDATVMVQGPDNNTSNTWYQLTPDSSGNYVNGTWSQRAPMRVQRLYFGSNVLPDGRVFVVGGEYASDQGFSRSGEIYDPVANAWMNTSTFPQSRFGDDPTEVLSDGRILAGYVGGPQTYLYDPAADTWTPTGTKLRNDQSDEESWVKLNDDSILSYDIFATLNSGVGHAQRYIPATGTWVDASTNAPNNLSSSAVGEELGPAFLLPDDRIFFIGATGHTAFYLPSSDSWVAGPDVPGGLAPDDAPGAELPNGKILFAADHPLFNGPTTVFEFDPIANSYTNVTPVISGLSTSQACYFDRMVVLPTGQVLYSTGGNQLAIYTPDGTPVAGAQPLVAGITSNGDGTYTLTGTQLNGISEGACYGDDVEMASNYPIVQLTADNGTVSYARTFNWNATGVGASSGATSVEFQLPFGTPPSHFSLSLIANGIASDAVDFVSAAGASVINFTPSSPVNGAVSIVRFTFNESIIPRTFADIGKSIVSFTDPNGNPLVVNSVRPVDGSNNTQFDVSFATQTQAGTYTMVIGPKIKDFMHRQMDQDQDGIAGQPDDEYTATFTIEGARITNFVRNGSPTNPPTNVRVTFNEPVDPTTFDPSQVAFTDPNGNPITVNSVSPVSGSNNTQFDIAFDSQTTVGTYSMTIGPNILDQYGNPMPVAFMGTFNYTDNLLTNPGFETGNFTGWMQSGNTQSTSVGTDFPHTGTYAADLGPAGPLGFLSQTVSTTPGQTYTLDYWLDHPYTNSVPNEFKVTIGGTVVYDQTNLGNFGYTEFTFTYTATSTTTAIQFGFHEDPAFFYLDDVYLGPTHPTAGQGGGSGRAALFPSSILGVTPLVSLALKQTSAIPAQPDQTGTSSPLPTGVGGDAIDHAFLFTMRATPSWSTSLLPHDSAAQLDWADVWTTSWDDDVLC